MSKNKQTVFYQEVLHTGKPSKYIKHDMSEQQANYRTKAEDNFKTRLLEERDQLKERTDKLASFIKSDKFESVSATQMVLLYAQYSHMNQYLDVLNSRIKDLESDNDNPYKLITPGREQI